MFLCGYTFTVLAEIYSQFARNWGFGQLNLRTTNFQEQGQGRRERELEGIEKIEKGIMGITTKQFIHFHPHFPSLIPSITN